MKILFVLFALICLISLFGCKTSVDTRVSDDEATQVLDRYEMYGVLGDQISSSESHKRPKQGLSTEATLSVVVN